MKLHADCAFTIGSRHMRLGDPCQDYAIAGIAAGRAYAVVSDGCSTGGRTDVGARLISLAAARELRVRDDVDPPHLRDALGSRPFDTEVEDLYATCITAAVDKDGRAIVRVQGDGVVAFVGAGGDVTVTRLEWSRNMPCYPAYGYDWFRKFIAAQGGPDALAFHVMRVGVSAEPLAEVKCSYAAAQAVNGHVLTWDPTTHGPLGCVAIFSDGVCQIEGVGWLDAVLELLAFKSVAGRFVTRRLNRFIKDALEQEPPRGPIDDLAVAAIVVEPS